MTIQYNLLGQDGTQFLTVVLNGGLHSATSEHPNWKKILEKTLADDTNGLEDLFDMAKAVTRNFQRVSDRVALAGGRVLFDGDEVENAVTKQILRFVEEGVEPEKYLALVNFMEKVETNPEAHSREQLYEWLDRNDFAIDEDGDIIGYKSVRKTETPGVFQSMTAGTAFVNGEEKVGNIPQSVGDVVEMPRSSVAWNPQQGCAQGLHVANYSYATTWASYDYLLRVKVNPRDVVSVPTESSFSKVRVCRYQIVEVNSDKMTSPIYASPAFDEDEDEDDYYRYYEDEDDEY